MFKTQKWVLLTLYLGVALICGCIPKQALKIGFVAELTGHNSSLGVQGRNGALLAVEDINNQGGVAGKKLELVIRDNAGKKDQLLAVDQELMDSNIRILTGHMTSWESVTAYQMIGENGGILFSPTTSTPELNALQDHFFRMIPTNDYQSKAIAQYARDTLGLRRVGVLYDTDNNSFTLTYAQGFAKFFNALGGETAPIIGYSSAQTDSYFTDLVQQFQSTNPEGLLIIASSFDAALIAQETRLQNWNIPLMSSNWAYAEELIRNGGQAVEGLMISSHFNQDCQTPAYLDFKKTYEQSYGQSPVFVSILAYETIQVLAQALEATGGKTERIQAELNRQRDFTGLCDRIYLDENGDTLRNLYLIKIEHENFTVSQTIEPAP